MDIVLSNGKGRYSEEEIINLAVQSGIHEVELYMDKKRLLELESLDGEEKSGQLEAKLRKAGVNLYGFCFYTDFNLFEDILLAKKCVNLLNRSNRYMEVYIQGRQPGYKEKRRTYARASSFYQLGALSA